MKKIKKLIEIILTLFLWLAYTAFALTLVIVYIIPLFFILDRRKLFQNYIYIFLNIAVPFTSLIMPGLRDKIYNRKEIKNITSSIILCNHLSFVDALLVLMSNNHTVAIIRDEFFRIPFLGWVLDRAGFIPVFTKEKKAVQNQNKLSKMHMDRVEGIKKTIDTGTNILIFPEGTRGTTDKVKEFKLGAFKIAKKLNIPLELLKIRNTHKLLNRNTMIFSGFSKNTMSLEKIGKITAPHDKYTASEIKEEAYNIFNGNIKKRKIINRPLVLN